MESKKSVVAIVVTYNRKKLLKECIEALLMQDVRELDIMIIDNASTDGTKEYINSCIEKNNIMYFNTQKNIGGAGGFNFGIKKAYNLNYDYFWLMDDDTIVKKNSLQELIEASNVLENDFGYLSSSVLWIDGKPCVMNKQKITNQWYDKSELLEKSLIQTYYSTFVSFFVRREVVREIGLPIKDFFIWGDDVEYSNRISKKYNCYMVGKSQVIHKTKDNNGSNISKENNERITRYKYAYRNECVIARENGVKGIFRQWAKVNFNILRVLCSKNKYKIKKIYIIVSSSIKGIFFRPKIEFVGD